MNDVTERKSCSAKYNGDFFCIETYSGYNGTKRDPHGKQHLLFPEASNEQLGNAVLDALAHSRTISIEEIPEFFDYEKNKTQYAEWIKQLMERYRYKTKGALFKKMRDCSIDLENNHLKISPSHHEKLEGWEDIDKEYDVVIPFSSSLEEIGTALRLAFSRCTGIGTYSRS